MKSILGELENAVREANKHRTASMQPDLTEVSCNPGRIRALVTKKRKAELTLRAVKKVLTIMPAAGCSSNALQKLLHPIQTKQGWKAQGSQ